MNIPLMKTENVIELRKLRDTVSASLAMLGNLGRPVIHWDDLLVYVIKNFALARVVNGIFYVQEYGVYLLIRIFTSFWTLRIRGLIDLSDSLKISDRFVNDKTRSSVNNVSALKCVHCHGNHIVLKCEDFSRKSVTERSSLARQLKLCFNCLKPGHFTPKCPSRFRCTHCSRMHHTLLHSASETSDKNENSVAVLNDVNPISPIANKVLLNTIGEAVADVQIGFERGVNRNETQDREDLVNCSPKHLIFRSVRCRFVCRA